MNSMSIITGLRSSYVIDKSIELVNSYDELNPLNKPDIYSYVDYKINTALFDDNNIYNKNNSKKLTLSDKFDNYDTSYHKMMLSNMAKSGVIQDAIDYINQYVSDVVIRLGKLSELVTDGSESNWSANTEYEVDDLVIISAVNCTNNIINTSKDDPNGRIYRNSILKCIGKHTSSESIYEDRNYWIRTNEIINFPIKSTDIESAGDGDRLALIIDRVGIKPKGKSNFENDRVISLVEMIIEMYKLSAPIVVKCDSNKFNSNGRVYIALPQVDDYFKFYITLYDYVININYAMDSYRVPSKYTNAPNPYIYYFEMPLTYLLWIHPEGIGTSNTKVLASKEIDDYIEHQASSHYSLKSLEGPYDYSEIEDQYQWPDNDDNMTETHKLLKESGDYYIVELNTKACYNDSVSLTSYSSDDTSDRIHNYEIVFSDNLNDTTTNEITTSCPILFMTSPSTFYSRTYGDDGKIVYANSTSDRELKWGSYTISDDIINSYLESKSANTRNPFSNYVDVDDKVTWTIKTLDPDSAQAPTPYTYDDKFLLVIRKVINRDYIYDFKVDLIDAFIYDTDSGSWTNKMTYTSGSGIEAEEPIINVMNPEINPEINPPIYTFTDYTTTMPTSETIYGYTTESRALSKIVITLPWRYKLKDSISDEYFNFQGKNMAFLFKASAIINSSDDINNPIDPDTEVITYILL